MKFLWQSGLILVSFGFVFLWELSPLADFTIQILALFVAIFLGISLRNRRMDPTALMGNNGLWSIFLLNTIIMLLIFATGGLNSFLFFLIYFLGFAIAFVFEPLVVFVFMLSAICVFIPDIIRDDVYGNAIKAGSILLIGPLAYFFGREFRKEEQEEKELAKEQEKESEKADTIYDDVSKVLENERGKIDPEDAQILDDVLRQTDELRNQSE